MNVSVCTYPDDNKGTTIERQLVLARRGQLERIEVQISEAFLRTQSKHPDLLLRDIEQEIRSLMDRGIVRRVDKFKVEYMQTTNFVIWLNDEGADSE